MAYNDSTDANIGDLENPPYDEVQFDSESSAAYQFGIGYKIDSMFTIELSLQHNAGFELEGPYYDNGILLADTKTTVDLQTTAVMMNGQLDMATVLDIDWKVRPYIGVGMGYVNNKLDTLTFDPANAGRIEGDTENNFAWKVSLGATFPLTEHFAFDLAYSYADYGDANSDRDTTDLNGVQVTLASPLTFDVTTQDILLSVRYLF
jgi:opacity protein-like surface antigen